MVKGHNQLEQLLIWQLLLEAWLRIRKSNNNEVNKRVDESVSGQITKTCALKSHAC